MDSFKLQKCKKYNGLFKFFILTFFIIAALIAGSLALYYKKKSNDYIQYLKITENQTLKLEKSIILQKFNALNTDIILLANHKNKYNLFEKETADSKKLTAKKLIEYSKMKRLYDQIRFIDKNGKEIFKINYNNGAPKAVSDNNLKSQKDRSYFRDAYSLRDKQIYISPLELFIENEKIAQPIKPIVLFGTPVFDKHGEKQGIIIINYLAEEIITAITNLAKLSSGETMLVNSEGYWLLGAGKNNHNWGFMYKNRLDHKISKLYPAVWKNILKNNKLQIITNKGLFSSITIPLSQLFKETNLNTEINSSVQIKTISDTNEHFWKLITFVPKKDFVSDVNKTLSIYLFWLGRLLFTLSTIPAFLIAYAITKRRYMQLELYRMANFDKLTNLPNRKHFFEALQHSVRKAIRSKSIFALLYLDIDNFKKINDTLGHDQGDNLLKEAASRFLDSVRNSDLVARIGGDEFVIILYNIKSIENAETVANKILDNFSRPFLLAEEEVHIGVSIGISLFSKNTKNDSILVKQADSAMYKAKQSGKNKFKIFIEETKKK